jgi:glycosyltransferase involved in cell wall biosynthesis
LIWCVNGVPEERSLSPRLRDRAVIRLEWLLRRLDRRPDLTVTVSEPMSAYVRRHTGFEATYAAPCCVDRSTYQPVRPLMDRGPVVAYLGSGAAWQALERTAAIWAAAAERCDDIEFLVVSRDDRCDRLLAGLEARGRRVSVTEPAEVAAELQAARVGMLVRDDHIVNRLAFPTKLGEYVACGLGVLASDLSWDVSRYVRTSSCGATVPPSASVTTHAAALLELLAVEPDVQAARSAAAAELLDRDRWIDLLADALAGDRPQLP